MRVIVNEVSLHLCKILTLIIVKTYLQTERRLYRIVRRSVVACYNFAKPSETSKSVCKHSETHSFFAGRTSIVYFLRRLRSENKFQNLEAKKSALL